MDEPQRATPKWDVCLSASAARQKKKLPLNIVECFARLLKDLEETGPAQPTWTNYSPLKKGRRIPANSYHCHLKSGKPTYVACWQVINKKIRLMEIFYAGTHENAPY